MTDQLRVGEALVGSGDEVAHVDLLIGPREGPVGAAFSKALSRQRQGHNVLLAVIEPNLPSKPDTLLFNKVTIKGARQATQMFGPAQAAVARAVADSVEDGTIPRHRVDDLAILVGVFIHWEAQDEQKIYDWNYEATKLSIQRALAGEPTLQQVLDGKAEARHPFAEGAETGAAGGPGGLKGLLKKVFG